MVTLGVKTPKGVVAEVAASGEVDGESKTKTKKKKKELELDDGEKTIKTYSKPYIKEGEYTTAIPAEGFGQDGGGIEWSGEKRTDKSQRRLWMSTEGSGVPWLHVRLDSRPKYYKHHEYTDVAALK